MLLLIPLLLPPEKKKKERKKLNIFQLAYLCSITVTDLNVLKLISCKQALTGIYTLNTGNKCVRKTNCSLPQKSVCCPTAVMSLCYNFPLLTTHIQYPNKSISPELWRLWRHKKHFWASRYKKKKKSFPDWEKTVTDQLAKKVPQVSEN